MQSQYAQISDLTTLSITSAAGVRFGNAAMTAALQAASSICDSYLSSQFTLPLVTSPQGWDMSLTLTTTNIAAWLLYNQFGFAPQAPGDDLVVKRYESALDWLAQVRDKKIFPVFADSANAGGVIEQGAFIISDPPVGFTGRGVIDPATGTWIGGDVNFDPWD